MNATERFVVGLTGGIGSGKSAAARIFRESGVEVIDADALAREVVEPGRPALADIASHFGSEVIAEDGNLDRAALRTIVFSDPDQRLWLEDLLHPLIAELLENRLQAVNSPYAILESPLLLETEQHKLADRVLVIDATEETQLARAMQRDGSNEEVIRSIIASQISRSDRSQRADDLVLNEGSLEELRLSIMALHRNYLEMSTVQ
ncbi:MAG: dephospho-CoA kinase [Pseudohongiella sp.]|nr:MAG: dephospho-CoA kinase [Pseudohongiella sp.]